MLVLPCGGGKTIIFVYLAWKAMMKGNRVLILAHRTELLDQISDTLQKFHVKHSFIAPGRHYNYRDMVHVGSVFTVARRLKTIRWPNLIILDEAHHVSKGSTWSKVIMAFKDTPVVGVTASPRRLSGEALGDTFDDLIVGPTVSELTAQGHLCGYRLFAPSTIDTSGIRTSMGDFHKTELNKAVDKPSITGDAVKHYRKLADGKRAIVFCCSIEHSRHVAEEFRNAGYRAAGLDGTMGREVRQEIVRDFRAGKLQVLTNCDIISEGFDLPAIEVAIMLRPTQSTALWIQQSGRALRPMEGKEYAIILDHAGNSTRHGLPDEDHKWSLEGKKRKRNTDSEPNVSIRTCAKCYAVAPVHHLKCYFCGYVFEIKSRQVDEIEGELEEVDPVTARRQRLGEQKEAQGYEQLVALGKARGYKRPNGWASHIIEARKKKRYGDG